MLLVPTVLAPSSIQGIGLFTLVPIPEGTTIWDYDPSVDWRLRADELERFPEPYRSRLREWCYEESEGRFVLCGDNAKFMNHSFEPNCLDTTDVTVAGRDIAAGEELTCDYREIDLESKRSGLSEWTARLDMSSANLGQMVGAPVAVERARRGLSSPRG